MTPFYTLPHMQSISTYQNLTPALTPKVIEINRDLPVPLDPQLPMFFHLPTHSTIFYLFNHSLNTFLPTKPLYAFPRTVCIHYALCPTPDLTYVPVSSSLHTMLPMPMSTATLILPTLLLRLQCSGGGVPPDRQT